MFSTPRAACLALSVLALLSSGCSNSKTSPKQSESYSGLEILADGQTLEIDSSINAAEAEQLQKDLDLLKSIRDFRASPELAEILELESEESTQRGLLLHRWLAERIRFIVGEDFDGNFKVARGADYSKASLFSSLDETLEPLMINLGSVLYREGRVLGSGLRYSIGGQSLILTTPRAGIVKMSKKFFGVSHGSFWRLSVLFHEARHSDGNGDHVGFPHVSCGPGSQEICDQHSNGPYGVQIAIATHFIHYCDAKPDFCGDSEKQELLRIIGTSSMRILVPNADPASEDQPGSQSAKKAPVADARPERIRF